MESVLKLYKEKEIHRGLIQNTVLNLAIRFNKKDFDINEYDVQDVIHVFLKEAFRNTEAIIRKERHGKFDCTVSVQGEPQSKKKLKQPKKGDVPVLLYELKTYLKPTEEFNTKAQSDQIFDDLHKLSKKVNSATRGYFIMAAKDTLLKKKLIPRLSFIDDHFEKSRVWQTVEWKNKRIRFRPSNRATSCNITVMSWEILPEKLV